MIAKMFSIFRQKGESKNEKNSCDYDSGKEKSSLKEKLK
jgi:hypothetical protein